jgi:glucose 1-dehydrogenase
MVETPPPGTSKAPAAPAPPVSKRIPQVPYFPLLRGQPALVTGANSGIGETVALGFARAGADVAVNYVVRPEAAGEVAHKIEAFGQRAIVLKADVGQEDQVERMFTAEIAHFGTLHVVVSSAGLQRDAAFDEMALDQWNTVIGVNLRGQFLCTRAAAREFKRRGVDPSISVAAGKIICMSSVHQVIPWAGHANYAASKGGVMMLMESIAQELAPHRIRMNSIGPGAIRTPINTSAWNTPEALCGSDASRALQAHRRARGYRTRSGLAGIRCRRLRDRHDTLRRRRHDSLPGFPDRRLRPACPPARR